MEQNIQLPQQLIQNGLNLLDGNLNATFVSNLHELLQTHGINTNQLWRPAIDLIDSQTTVLLYIYIPGINSESISVDFFNDIVHVKGERDFPTTNNNIIDRNQEIVYGPFERRIKLPMSITRRESVNISLDNGVMLITIDKNSENTNRFSLTVDDFE